MCSNKKKKKKQRHQTTRAHARKANQWNWVKAQWKRKEERRNAQIVSLLLTVIKRLKSCDLTIGSWVLLSQGLSVHSLIHSLARSLVHRPEAHSAFKRPTKNFSYSYYGIKSIYAIWNSNQHSNNKQIIREKKNRMSSTGLMKNVPI